MKYDIIIIGAGSGGLNIAGFMNKVGFNTLLIDKSDSNIGGDCLNFGCVPSKALIHTARVVHESSEAFKFGIITKNKTDLRKVMNYVRNKVEHIRKHENAAYFKSQGIDIALGNASFVSKNCVKVGDKIYSAKKIVLATGSRPRKLNIKGIEKVRYLTNENIFNLKKLPKKLLIIGGGPIGIEISQAFARFGSEVTVIQRESSFLPKENPEITNVLLKKLLQEGIKFSFNSEPLEFTSPHEVIIKKGNIKKKIRFDNVLISIGRVLNIEGLNLEKAGVEYDKGKIKVDRYLRTTNKKILLCGDIAGSYQFTHAAELHARIIINNFFSLRKMKLNYDKFAWVTYTDPEIATFGLSEHELSKRGIKHDKITAELNDDDRAIVDESTEGKLILHIAKNKIIGGTMIARNAGELIQELILANNTEMKIKQLFSKTYPYPTATRINKRAIGTYLSRKLTPASKKILRLLYR